MSKNPPVDDVPLFCDRCVTELQPGQGNFYVVRIEAVADPSPPNISPEDSASKLRDRIGDLIAEMRDASEQELVDQVYRRLTLYLCGNCYRQWIENPTG